MTFHYSPDFEHGLDRVRSDTLSLTVRRLGAEVIGLTRHHPELGDVGLIWRNDHTEDPPQFWKGHAPVLFPIVGGMHGLTSRTTDGTQVTFQKQHGFARHSVFQLLGHGGGGQSYVLNYHLIADDQTLAMYPWRFELWVRYELFADRLEQTMTVRSLDEKAMPFQIGWHPGFNTPQYAGAKAGCRLRLPEGEAVQLGNDENCYLTGEAETVTLARDFAFDEAQLDATYMFDFSATPPERRAVELFDPDERIGVRVAFPDYPHLGVWSDAGAPFICIEPWQGMDDSIPQEPFDRKFGIVTLAPGAERSFRAAIHLIER
jgi:galactose mutarotase-like enzyme